MSTKDKIKLFIMRDGVDALIGIAILLVVGISAFFAEDFSMKNLTVIVPLLIATVGWYAARYLNRKNGMVQQQKEFHEKMMYNVEHDMETGHYDYELRMNQLKAYHQTMIINGDEYRELKARYDEKEKERQS